MHQGNAAGGLLCGAHGMEAALTISANEQLIELRRGAVDLIHEEDLKKRIEQGRPL